MNETPGHRRDPAAIDALLKEYVSAGHYKIPGFAHEWDLRLFADLLAWQSANGFGGDLAEIGVHHGRSFLILALRRHGAEKAVAMDLFEDDHYNADHDRHAGRGAGFFNTLQKYNVTLGSEEIIKGSSLDLSAESLRQKYQAFRFFSIDGGHFYHHVENDLELAAQTIAEHGVICVDDWMNLHWPEVSIAAGNFMRDEPERLEPFLVSQNKLYLCRPTFLAVLQRDYLATLAQRLGPVLVSEVQMFGKPVMSINFRMSMRIAVLLKTRLLR